MGNYNIDWFVLFLHAVENWLQFAVQFHGEIGNILTMSLLRVNFTRIKHAMPKTICSYPNRPDAKILKRLSLKQSTLLNCSTLAQLINHT